MPSSAQSRYILSVSGLAHQPLSLRCTFVCRIGAGRAGGETMGTAEGEACARGGAPGRCLEKTIPPAIAAAVSGRFRFLPPSDEEGRGAAVAECGERPGPTNRWGWR